jgi:SAM-dependent methyltransferase
MQKTGSVPDAPATPNEPAAATPLTSRSFTAWPAWADLSLESVHYGPDIPTEAELRLLGRLEGKRVLELGCGGGPAAVAMAKQGARVIAVDESIEQMTHARRLAEREDVKLELHQGDLADLAFVRADTIDVALSVYALGSVDDLDRVFRQVHRVLKPEAPLVLSLAHPAYTAVDPSTEPPVLRRRWFDQSPVPWPDGGGSADQAHSVTHVFTSLHRANFRVDALLEPEPGGGLPRSRHWTPAMAWVPSTIILRARKQGI